ncbi:hypothetical protein, partial [Streptococcus sobrinus]|uniref:hypothetical protein n=1 Tax=Streptococcus sobrinus TaxID=1310 RepID=UPI001C4001F9
MNDIKLLGAQHKAASDAMINSDTMLRQGMMQTAGAMLNMSTQASKISDNYTRMQNPMYLVNQGGLAIADSMN